MVIPVLLTALLFLSSGAPAGAAPAADRLERFREIALSRLAVVENTGGALDPSVQGELDIDTSPALAEVLNKLIETDGITDLSLALADVTFIDSSGLQTVLKTSTKLLDHGRLVVASASLPVKRLMDVAGVTQLLQ